MLHQRPKFVPVLLDRSALARSETAPMLSALPVYPRFDWAPEYSVMRRPAAAGPPERPDFDRARRFVKR